MSLKLIVLKGTTFRKVRWLFVLAFSSKVPQFGARPCEPLVASPPLQDLADHLELLGVVSALGRDQLADGLVQPVGIGHVVTLK